METPMMSGQASDFAVTFETLSLGLIEQVMTQFTLRREGAHGIGHWARVLENGRRLATKVDVPVRVVELFAVLHDSQRLTESVDRQHGERAGLYARELARQGAIQLPHEELEALVHACHFHSAGLVQGPLVVQVCWDADRLDLGRVGNEPVRERLCTEAAREPDIFDWARARGGSRIVPDLIAEEWGVTYRRGAARPPPPAP